jgi:hypothetical protein
LIIGRKENGLLLPYGHQTGDLAAKVILDRHEVIIYKAAMVESKLHNDFSSIAPIFNLLRSTSMRQQDWDANRLLVLFRHESAQDQQERCANCSYAQQASTLD